MVMIDKTNFQPFFADVSVRPITRAADNCCRKGQPQPAPHELRPLHFVNRGGFTSAGISLQVRQSLQNCNVWQDIFHGNQQAVEPLVLLFQSVALVPRAKFAAEMLREIRSVSLRALAVKLEP